MLFSCFFLNYWAGKDGNKENLDAGANIIEANAVDLHPRQNADDQDEEERAMVVV